MKKILFSFLLISFSFVHAQNVLGKKQLKEITDSILIEGNTLYKYEKSAWVSIDLVSNKNEIKDQFVDYLVYEKNDTIKTIIINKENRCIAEFSYVYDFYVPNREKYNSRSLNEAEQNLLTIRNTIIKGILDQNIAVTYPEGYGINMIMLPFETGYKYYILTGTSQADIIPFGNDYLFVADRNGTIISSRKFHTKLMPLQTVTPSGDYVTQTIHSHLKTEPYISATDICTFKLYGNACKQTSFLVYSPELSIYFKYKLAENQIEIRKKAK